MPERVFPLDCVHLLFGLLVSELEKLCPPDAKRWRGLRLVACDKTTLQLTESKALWKKYGHHDIRTHVGPVAVEFCRFMTVLARAPFAFTIAPADTSEDKLLKKLKGRLRKSDLLLIDNGFYGAANFKWILAQGAHFLIPANTAVKPKLLKELGASDYCARRKITVRPGRRSSRDKQEYRRKSRGLVKGKAGRPRKPTPQFKRQDRMFATYSKGNTYLLS